MTGTSNRGLPYRAESRVQRSAKLWRVVLYIFVVLILVCTELRPATSAQELRAPVPAGNPPFATKQVVENLIRMNLARSKALRAYHGTRTYRVDYRGLPSARQAEMVVDVAYRYPGTKEFKIRSATGFKLVIDRVFKKLLEAEESAQTPEAQSRVALNNDNYDFKLRGTRAPTPVRRTC